MERGICGTCKVPVTLILDGKTKRWVHDVVSEVQCFVLRPTEVLPV